MPRLFFIGCIGETQPSVNYLMREKKERFGKGFKPLSESEAKPSPPEQSVKFKCQIWFKITKKCAKKCLDVPSRA